MTRSAAEPMQIVKQRRDALLSAMVARVPYLGFLGISFDRRGDELTGVLAFRDDLIGNPDPAALHGGVIASFLETTAILELSWKTLWPELERKEIDPLAPEIANLRLPRTIGLTVDYLRPGLPRDAYARARVTRFGRRYASVQVEAWQDNRARPIAQATGHFLMPNHDD